MEALEISSVEIKYLIKVSERLEEVMEDYKDIVTESMQDLLKKN
ncbi:hypothetical protein [Patiriisocius sp. Uisw_017]